MSTGASACLAYAVASDLQPAKFPLNINRHTLQGSIRFIGSRLGYSFTLRKGGNSVNIFNFFITSFGRRVSCQIVP